jgi:hypothetical protein
LKDHCANALSFYVTKTVLVGPKWFWSDQIDLDLTIMQGCIKCMRPPAMAMVQIENFCPFSDWLKNNLNFVLVTNPKTEILKTIT